MFRRLIHFMFPCMAGALVLVLLPLPVSATSREAGVAPMCNAMGNLVALTTTWRDAGMPRAHALKQLRAATADPGQRALAEVFVDIPYSNPQISGAQILQTFHTACPGLIRQQLVNK